MENREHDLFLEMLDNPQASFDTMIINGLNAKNTSIQNKEKYKNDEWVRKQFSDQFGNFNEDSFNKAYDVATIYYNNLADTNYNDSVKNITSYHRSNIFAPQKQKRTEPDFQQFKMSNPYQQTFNLVTFGKVDEPTKSIDELAQSNKVLANPTTAGDNLENAIWEDSPNDSFFGHLLDTLVLAQYDSDGTHIDPITNQTVEHKKGDLKLDNEGNFFYEKLDGRDVYGRSVLNKMNVLTTDGSFWNKFDFFDSDDLNQQNPVANVLKNAALVGTMFVSGIGPWVRGLSIATQLAGVGATFMKMLAGDDMPILNEIEGLSKSFNRQTARTQYAQEHTWCWENFINLIGDVMGQLAEQRFIFEKLPYLVTGSNLMTKEGQAAKLAELQNANKKFNQLKIEELLKNPSEAAKLTRLKQSLNISDTFNAQSQLDSFIKGYNKLGEILSKGYMTAIVVGDTYGEAKQAGASDMDAALLTLGYAAGEYALLNTGLGEWVLPELRANRYRYQAIQRALMNLNEETIQLRQQFGNMLKTLPKEGKKQYAKELFKVGKSIANAEYATGAKTMKATLAAGVGEGFEEVSEEILADFSKACFNLSQWLSGSDARMTSFGYDPLTGEWNTSDIIDRYGMSLIGGAIGGGLANLGLNYKAFNSLSNMTSQQAVEQLVYLLRNGEGNNFLKSLDKVEIGNPYLSATEVQEQDGQLIFAPGTKENNQDLYAKRAIKAQVQLIQNILDANGANLSDDSFLNKQTLGDLRFAVLHKSTMAGAYLNRFNNLISEVIRLTNNSNLILDKAQDTNNDGVVTDLEARRNKLSEDDKKQYDKVVKELNNKRKELQDLIDGKYSYEFVADALFEMTETLSGLFTETTLPLFAEKHFGKKWSELTEKDKAAAQEAYNNWKVSDGRDKIREVSATFRQFAQKLTGVLQKIDKRYLDNLEDSKKLSSIITNLSTSFNIAKNAAPEVINMWLNEATTIDNIVSLKRALVEAFGTESDMSEIENIEKQIAELDPNLSKDEKEAKLKDLNYNYKAAISNVLIRDISKYIDPIVNRGFINTETKNQITRVLNNLIAISQAEYANEERKLPEMQFEPSEPMMYWQEKIDTFVNLRDKVEKLDNTLFAQDIDEISISTGQDPINITQLINRLDTYFKDVSDNISKFNIGEQLVSDLNNAIFTLQMYKAAVLAARTDSADIDDYYGYNATLNEISEKLEDKRPKLAEINKDTADTILSDINLNLNRLVFLRNLYRINQGQKILKQNRIATTTDLLIYNRIRNIVQIRDDDELKSWNGILELQTIVNGLQLHDKISKSDSKEVSESQKEDFERESIELGDAIYDFFQKNLDKLNDINKLQEFINPKRLQLYTLANGLLNEGSTSLDDNTILWWLASRAAIKSSDFYNQYKQIIELNSENPIMPIFSQELAVYNNYASILNGNIFTQFFEAYRRSVVNDWKNKTVQERETILRSLNRDTRMASDEFADYVLNIVTVPRYSNTTLTEGIPGAGKSQAVFKVTLKMLQKFNPSLLKSVSVVHGSGFSNAQKLLKDVGLTDQNAKSYDRQGWMKEINPQWTEYSIDPITGYYIIPKSDFTVSDQNEVVSSQSVKKMSNPPSLIIIDEVQKFTSYDMDQINNFAKENGITVLVAGDFDQAGIVGAHSIELKSSKPLNWSVNLERTNFARSPKLSVSMRTDNVIKTRNQEKLQAYMQSPTDQRIDFEYYEDDSGLYGDQVVIYEIQDDTVSQDKVTTAKASIVQSVLEKVDKLIDTLKEGQKIGYIYSDKTSPLFKELSSEKYSKYIDFKEGGSSHGDEGQYYIIEAQPNAKLVDSDSNTKQNALDIYLKDIYTGMTRAQQGSIVIIPVDIGPKFGSVRVHSNVSEQINRDSIIQYSEARKEILDKIANDGKAIPYTPRTQTGISVKSSIVKKEGLSEGTDPTPPEKTSTFDSRKQILIDSINKATSIQDIDNLINEFIRSEQINNPDKEILEAKQRKIAEIIQSTPLEIISYDNITNKPAAEAARKIAIQSPKTDEGLDSNDINSDLKYGTIIRLNDNQYGVIVGIKLSQDGNHQYHVLLINTFDTTNNYGFEIKQYQRSDINGIVEVIQEYENETEPDGYDYGGNLAPITDNDTTGDLEYSGELDLSSEDLTLPQSYVNPVIEQETIGINMLLHSFNTFETGVLFDDNGNPIPNGTTNWEDNPRIDSINGLVKIDLLQSKGIKTKQLYLEQLGNIRSLLFNIKDKSTLIDRVSNYLKLKGVYITFALKSSPRPSDRNKQNNQEFVEGTVSRFSKGISETTEYNGSSDTRSKEWHHKSLVAIIGTKQNGDLLEIPLLATSSPFTLMQISDGNGKKVFQEVYDEYLRLQSDNMSEHDITLKLIEKFDGNVQYQDLINLFKLYDFTFRGIHFVHDPNWTIAKDLESLGPQFVTNRGYYQGSPGFHYDNGNPESEWTTVSQFATNPQVTITSKVMVSLNGEVDGGDGTSVKLVKAGNPFVLVSFDKSLNSDLKIIKYFIKQSTDPDTPKKVQLMYVMPPKASIDKYIENIKNIFSKQGNVKRIGTLFTSYKLMKELMKDNSFRQYLSQRMPNIVAKIDQAIQEIDSLPDNISKKNKLYETAVWNEISSKPRSLSGLFDGILMSVVYNRNTLNALIDGEVLYTFNQSGLDMIKSILLRSGIDGVRYDSYIPRNNPQKIGQFYVIEQGNNYSIDNKPFKIHGKIDSYVFRGNISWLVNQFLGSLRQSADGRFSFTVIDGYKYMRNGRSDLDTQISQEEITKNNILSEIKQKTGLDLSNLYENQSINKANELAVQTINQNSDNIAFIINGNVVISKRNDALKGRINIIFNNRNITDISSLSDNNGVFQFNLEIDGVSYNAEYDSKNSELTMISNDESISEPVALIVNENNFDEYMNSAREALEELFSYDLDYEDLFKSNTLDEFLEKLNNMDYIGEDRITDLQSMLNNNLTDFQRNIINQLIEIERSHDDQKQTDNCPINIKIKF